MPTYPGLGQDLRHVTGAGYPGDLYPIGMHENSRGADSEMLLVREVAMMAVMELLTDKPDFHIKVYDETVTNKWIEEALAIPDHILYDQIVGGTGNEHPKRLKLILDRQCLQYCIKELQRKAKFFTETGLIPTLDASASVVKSDVLVKASLHAELQAAFAKLKLDHQEAPDWHPGTNSMVQNLVHPSLHPLIYGKMRVFQDEVVGIDDAVDSWAGRGEIIQSFGPGEHRRGVSFSGSGIDASFWSTKYQWLPSNLALRPDGSVKFTSYINNLHPTKYRETYKVIERLIETVIPAWDVCLTRYRNGDRESGGRTHPRFPQPESCDDEDEGNWSPTETDFENTYKAANNSTNTKDQPSGSGPASRDEDEDEDDVETEDEDGEYYTGSRVNVEWKKIREPAQLVPPAFKPWRYEAKSGNTLKEQFDKPQVIVNIASIELTPEKPEFPEGSWHIEGQMNEHIVATALYYLDSENVTSSHLQFRMQTSSYQDDFQGRVGQDSYSWMERVYGAQLGPSSGSCLPNYGAVETKQGRVLAFPNVFHHRVSPFELVDKTKPGHRRFIAIWLVDPLTRIINTANVPPQQRDWWIERAFRCLGDQNAHNIPNPIAQLMLDKGLYHSGLEEAARKGPGLPAELMSLVRRSLGDAFPMSKEEANEHRLALMTERSRAQDSVRDGWRQLSYNFCEH